MDRDRPIGVFDSGVGGLSVLRALLAALPNERFVYLADSAHAPYGERGDAYVSARTHAITDYLCEQHGIKALVVACNTATAAAIHEVRSSRPALPLVGLEPAIKPALSATRTGHIGVIGTRGTLTSGKFGKLMASVADLAAINSPSSSSSSPSSSRPTCPRASTTSAWAGSTRTPARKAATSS